MVKPHKKTNFITLIRHYTSMVKHSSHTLKK